MREVITPYAIERQLAHVDPDKTRSTYNRAKYIRERQNMMQEWADYQDSLKENTDPQKEIIYKK